MKSLCDNILKPENLRRAWDDIAENAGAAGVDNVSVRVWRRNWEERLVNLANDVRANRYRASPLRERRIRKRNGCEWRTLRIPTVTDRVLQRAALQRLHPICEPYFLPCSFGYRPGLGVRDAVREITRLRRQGYTWVLDADIDDFFNSVDHALLYEYLGEDLPDDSLLPLVKQWISSDCVTPACDKGIPMGAPVSPLLANIFLHRLDQSLATGYYPLVRYADDFIVLTRSEEELPACYQRVKGILSSLKLRYEPRKTRLTSFDRGFDFLGVHFEETWYWYLWGGKRVEVRDGDSDWLFTRYGPEYE